MDFTCSPNWVFPTGLAYDFGQFDRFWFIHILLCRFNPIKSQLETVLDFWLVNFCMKECELIKGGHTSGFVAVNDFMMWIKITAIIVDENDWFFISDQMCPADVSRLQELGFWTYLQYCKCCIDCFVILFLSEPDKLNACSLFKARLTYSFISFWWLYLA